MKIVIQFSIIELRCTSFKRSREKRTPTSTIKEKATMAKTWIMTFAFYLQGIRYVALLCTSNFTIIMIVGCDRELSHQQSRTTKIVICRFIIEVEM